MSLSILQDDGKPYWKLIPVLVILTILMLWMNSYMPPADLAPKGYSSVILAFEFAQTRTEITEVMLPLSAEEIAGLDQVQRIDFGYMIAYSALLFGFFWISKKMTNHRYLILGMLLSLVALLADLFENIQLLDLTQLFMQNAGNSSYDTVLSNLFIFTWLKWGALAIALGLLVPLLWSRGRFSKVMACLLAISPIMLLVVTFVGSRSMMDKFGTSVIIGFLALAIYIIAYRKPKLA